MMSIRGVLPSHAYLGCLCHTHCLCPKTVMLVAVIRCYLLMLLLLLLLLLLTVLQLLARASAVTLASAVASAAVVVVVVVAASVIRLDDCHPSPPWLHDYQKQLPPCDRPLCHTRCLCPYPFPLSLPHPSSLPHPLSLPQNSNACGGDIDATC